MDIVLEVFDTYLFDRAYASILPASKSQYIGNLSHNVTSALLSIQEDATLSPTAKWVYEPASKYLNLQPSLYAYSSVWPRDNVWRQATSLFLITWLFGLFIYFVCASLSYYFVFDKETLKHPKFLKNQIRMEMAQAAAALPFMALMTAPCFVAEVRGYAKLYDSPANAPFAAYNFLQFPLFILFTDFFIYLIHRGLHYPPVYRMLHKPHHKWIITTPYASHAFHPVDGFAQSIPYHVFPFIFPLQKFAYVALFAFINVWTIFIHDGEYVANSPIINGAACHSLHHEKFTSNFGQFTTLWDRIGGTYLKPADEMFQKKEKKTIKSN